jgi:Protein of unknown function (DUF3568)
MTRPGWCLSYRTVLALLLAAAGLASSGCLIIAAGAAGGAAVTYAYCKGKVCGQYYAALGDCWAATHTALLDLGMPIEKEDRGGSTAFIVTRTADGERVRIYLDSLPSQIPAEAEMTRICVRVATFGDYSVSERIMDQIGRHLAPPQTAPPPALGAVPATPPPPAAGATLGPVRQAGGSAVPQNPVSTGAGQTAAPPLLPTEPVPIAK